MASKIIVDTIEKKTGDDVTLVGNLDVPTSYKITGTDADSIQAPGLITSAGGGLNSSLNTGLASATFPAGHVIQTVMNYNTGNLASTSGTNVSFGLTSDSAAITITSGNYVLVTMAVNVYTGGNYGGYVWMCRGIGPGNSGTDMARSTFKTHIDNMCYVSGMSGAEPHWYNTSGGHSYGHFTYQFLDTQLSRHTTPTQPRYSLALGGHPTGASITCGANWSYPCTWTLQEIQA